MCNFRARSKDHFCKTSGEKPFQDFCTSRADKRRRLELENDGLKGGWEAATSIFHLRHTLNRRLLALKSTIVFKKLLAICFAKLILTSRSALKAHKPFINTSHYSFCKNDPHYSSSPESAQALHREGVKNTHRGAVPQKDMYPPLN